MARHVAAALRRYRGSWFLGPDKARLRAECNNDQAAYLKAFRARTEDVQHTHDTPYQCVGQEYLDDLVLALKTGQRPSKNSLIVAIDFEGPTGSTKELGLSSFSTTQLFDTHNQAAPRLNIRDENFSIACGYGRGFAFGTTTRITLEILPRVLRNAFASYHDSCPDGIILVGHGLWSAEVGVLDTLGVPIESLPAVVGTIDTSRQLFDGTIQHLGGLLQANGIPYRPETLHCAGNDAHYTLRLVLLLVLWGLDPWHEREFGIFEVLQGLITRPLPIGTERGRQGEDDWWENMDGDLDMDFVLEIDEGDSDLM
ncbi:uncharacterized protein LTR77_004657 [Saxophila tyrrhenica]|uniref:Gfd2/YDR514C-like C-terminal domain-containing protein n=1 Tax=Saxophila tyrrhenica TaxID=1690608 RepID=A0AAV9PDE0_9PEZI|nr:hypothetical protein LTR77_004657 [Saxophila tyrrhenica]